MIDQDVSLYVEIALAFSDGTWQRVVVDVRLPDPYMGDKDVKVLAEAEADVVYGDMDALEFIHAFSVEPRSFN